jgi:hypothetical protein
VVHPLVVLGYFLGSRWPRGQYLLTCCRRETVSGREVILTRFPWRLDIPTHNHNRCRCFNKRHPRGIAAIHLFLDGDTTHHGHQHRAGHIAGFSGPLWHSGSADCGGHPGEAAGTVQFRDGTTNIGIPVLVRNGTALVTKPMLRGPPADRSVHPHEPGGLRPVSASAHHAVMRVADA